MFEANIDVFEYSFMVDTGVNEMSFKADVEFTGTVEITGIVEVTDVKVTGTVEVTDFVKVTGTVEATGTVEFTDFALLEYASVIETSFLGVIDISKSPTTELKNIKTKHLIFPIFVLIEVT